MARIFIGVAWPYSNGPFHIGHLAGAYLPGDIFARFHRLRGDEVLMVSGSDMHGTPTLVRAEKENTTPRAISERYHAVNKDAFERLGFTFDLYTNTHTVVHEKTVQELFLKLLEARLIGRRTAEAAYCPQHRRFLPDRYLVGTCPHCGFEAARGDECDNCGRPIEPGQLGTPRCVLCGTPAEFRPSEHFYLELDRLQEPLAEYVSRQQHWRTGTLRVAENFLKEGLHPTPITRDLDWGVPIPLDGYDTKRFYVWFDAVTGYLSASKEWAIRAGRPDAWQAYWDAREPVRQYYFVGKDNKFHHTIIWPGMLLGAGGFQLPYDVPANEWLLAGGKKVSKSGTVDADAFIPALLANYPPDVIRFYAAVMAPQNHDTELDWDEFRKFREEVLANQYGNLVQRTLVLTRDRCAGKVPAPPEGWSAQGSNGVATRLKGAHAKITEEYEKVHLKEALDLALEEVREANRRFHEARPWQASEPDRARILYETLWRLKALATWLAPVLPFSSTEVFRMLGYDGPPGPGEWDVVLSPVPAGQVLGEVRPLFPRPETERASQPASSAVAEEGWPPLAACSGIIRSATPHPSAGKLYVLEVDIGAPAPRTVVAGIREYYTPEALTGRPVVLLTNLAPRTIRRITSQGMVLCAETEERAILLAPPEGTPPGTYLEHRGPSDRQISFEEFGATLLTIGRVTGPAGTDRVRVDLGGSEVEFPGTWSTGTWVVVRRAPGAAGRAELLAFGPGRGPQPSEPVSAGAKVR
ncbi:MAG: methionine--tRNA ligase [Thermoplasmata archaeon]